MALLLQKSRGPFRGRGPSSSTARTRAASCSRGRPADTPDRRRRQRPCPGAWNRRRSIRSRPTCDHWSTLHHARGGRCRWWRGGEWSHVGRDRIDLRRFHAPGHGRCRRRRSGVSAGLPRLHEAARVLAVLEEGPLPRKGPLDFWRRRAMATSHEDIISALDELVATCRDGEEGLRAAAEAAQNAELRGLFLTYAQQRGDFRAELEEEIRRLGGTPSTRGSITGSLHRGWMSVRSAVGGGSDDSVVAEAKRGEDAAK